MPVDDAAVAVLVKEELVRIADKELAAALAKILVPPRRGLLEWDYGGEPNYPGFVVAEHHASGTGLAFSEHGFGPASPWGLIFLAHPGFGMDSGWYTTLEGAFRESMAWDQPPPVGYEAD